MNIRLHESSKRIMPMIFTKRCILRRMSLEDAEDLYSALSDSEVMKYIEPPFDMAGTLEFIKSAGLCEPPLVLAVEWRETGRVIGHAVFHPYSESFYEIGWILHRDYWGKGIASELTSALTARAAELKAAGCVIECDPRQAASGRIAIKNGFTYDGQSGGLDIYRLTLPGYPEKV